MKTPNFPKDRIENFKLKSIIKPSIFFTVFIIFLFFMVLIQNINDKKNYYSKVEILYNNNTSEIYNIDGRPDIYLNNGNLKVNGVIVRSYVLKFNQKVYKNKK